ncbi:peptidase G2 [Bacillus phage 268TH004]|uniref:Peptidase G2 n=1 Tax=Bacillus phage 268TH004 TaxID=2801523 RepID=A0A7T8C3T8_9CAUD|nr:peptidase [Bacillus phage 276BB001]QFG05941.1 peptidase [Bacillus phage 280BB001]QQO40365.1 peptidase G2 [Bacillus phage 268TH004]QZA70090.1 peptidase G2 [Bacillus phage 274BB002]
MPEYTDNLGLYKPNRQDDVDIDTSLTTNFETIDAKLGSALFKGNTQYQNLRARFEDIESLLNEGNGFNVRAYGAKGDGETDDTEAFIAAIGDGNRTVRVPAGHYRVREVKLPSNTYFIGEGKDLTIISSTDTAPTDNTIVSNADWINGNVNIVIKGMTVDWNKKGTRLSAEYPPRPWGCSVALIGATDCYIDDVFAKDGKVHCFEFTAPRDAKTPRLKRVWVSNCIATGAGDDNFTTHYCDHVYIENCYSYDPMGTFSNTSNTNCFEIDDGSTQVHISNCLAVGGMRGYEIKAHGEAPSGMNSSLTNCTAMHNIMGINIRHIGHHLATEPTSTTAWDITISDCWIYDPKRNAGIYDSNPVRAMEVSAYRNVNISNLHIINLGGSEIAPDDNVTEFRFKSENINVSNLTIRGFTEQAYDINVVGGENSKGRVNFINTTLWKSAKSGVFTGSGINNCNFISGQFIKDGGTGTYGFDMMEQGNNIIAFHQYGYATPARIDSTNYSHIPNRLRNGFLTGSSSGHPIHENSAVLASTSNPKATGDKSAVISSVGGSASGDRSTVINSSGSSATANASVVINGYNVINPTSDSIAGGYGSGSPSSTNRKWDINSSNGNIKAAGTVTGSSSFSDYAEYFESVDGTKIPTGTIVALEGGRIRPAQEGDYLLGVISETAGVVLGEASFSYAQRYLTNEFGGYIYEDVEITEQDENGLVTKRTIRVPKENPAYNGNVEYVSRADREEWNVVGLLGQVYVRIDETVEAGAFVTAKNGIATVSSEPTGWKVMGVTSLYDPEKGYGVAKIFIR